MVKRKLSWQKRVKKWLLDPCKVVLALVLTTIFALGLEQMNIRVENILMVYVLCVLVIILETKRYAWGIITSALCVLVFNFFFTEPLYSLHVNEADYYISFLIFLAVSLMITTLTIKLQAQIRLSKRSQAHADLLYKVNSGFLNLSGTRAIVMYGLNCFKMICDTEYVVYVSANHKGKSVEGQENNLVEYENPKSGAYAESPSLEVVNWCFDNAMQCGCGTAYHGNTKWCYLPIKSSGRLHGVLCIRDWMDEEETSVMNDDNLLAIRTVLSQLAFAVDREFLNLSEHESRLTAEKETMRSNLLRSISHDLRTPLTGISGSADFLLSSYETIDEASRKSLLTDIVTDSAWLGNLVENLLNMTRIQDGKLAINMRQEVVDDVVSEAIARVKSRLGHIRIDTYLPAELLLVPMDGQLIIQVLVNLMDNAIKYAKNKKDGFIKIVVTKEETAALFEIVDNGGGIDPQIINKLFDMFVSVPNSIADSKRGMGLGLYICDSIIGVHNGSIKGYNNEVGGATFAFSLPL